MLRGRTTKVILTHKPTGTRVVCSGSSYCTFKKMIEIAKKILFSKIKMGPQDTNKIVRRYTLNDPNENVNKLLSDARHEFHIERLRNDK